MQSYIRLGPMDPGELVTQFLNKYFEEDDEEDLEVEISRMDSEDSLQGGSISFMD